MDPKALLDSSDFLLEYKENGFVSYRSEPQYRNMLDTACAAPVKSRLKGFFSKSLCELLHDGKLSEFNTLVGTFWPLLNDLGDYSFDEYFECFEDCVVAFSESEKAKTVSNELHIKQIEFDSKSKELEEHSKSFEDLLRSKRSVRLMEYKMADLRSEVELLKHEISGIAAQIKKGTKKIEKDVKKLDLCDDGLTEKWLELMQTKTSIANLKRCLEKLKKRSPEERIAAAEAKFLDLKDKFEQLRI